MHWPFLPFLLQFAMGNYTQNWIKHETDCCKNRTFYSSFFVPKFRKDVAQWQNETALIRCNFISVMMSNTFSIPSSKHLAWKACQLSYASWFYMDMYLRNYNTELGRISSSLNQIAKRVNSTGNIYQDDMNEVKELMNKVWHTQKSMLSKQPLIKQ